METSDEGNSRETTMSQLHGFASRHPTSLLLVEPIQQGVELPMLSRISMIMTVPTCFTPTFVTWRPCHGSLHS